MADDPETRRILENTKIISQVKYHEDFEKNIKNKYTPVLDNPETARAIENQKIVSSAEYKGIKNQNQNQHGNFNGHYNGNGQSNGQPIVVQTSKGSLVPTFKNGIEKQTFDTQSQRKIGSIADYDPLSYEGPLNGAYQQQQYANGGRPISRNVYSTGNLNNHQPKLNGASTYNSTSNIINYSNGNGHHAHHAYQPQPQPQQAQTVYNNNGNHHTIGSYDIPINDIKTTVYKAIYDYDAKEDDEISFRDGDKFINCEQIDVGWMIGVHEKTGKHGMFPANYAEPVDYF